MKVEVLKNCLVIIGAGTIFRFREQKLNDFSVGEAKIGQKQSRHSNSKSNFMQHVFLKKKLPAVYNGFWGKAPEVGEFSRIFVLKAT